MLLVLLSLLLNKSRGERMTRGTKATKQQLKRPPFRALQNPTLHALESGMAGKLQPACSRASSHSCTPPHYIIHPDIVSHVQINPKTFDPCREAWRVVTHLLRNSNSLDVSRGVFQLPGLPNSCCGRSDGAPQMEGCTPNPAQYPS